MQLLHPLQVRLRQLGVSHAPGQPAGSSVLLHTHPGVVLLCLWESLLLRQREAVTADALWKGVCQRGLVARCLLSSFEGCSAF